MPPTLLDDRTVSLTPLQFLWTLLIMALVGNMIHDAKAGNPSIVNYCMFVAVFSMLCLIYLIAGTISEGLAGHPIIMVTVDALNTIFFLVGGIALAAYLGVHSCGNEVDRTSVPCTDQTLTHNRATLRAIASQTAPITPAKDVTKRRLHVPSSGLGFWHMWDRWCSPRFRREAEDQISAAAVFEEVGPPCPKSRRLR